MFSIITQTANLDQLDEKIDQQLMSEKESSNISCNSEKITRTTRSASLSKRTKSDPAIKLGRKHLACHRLRARVIISSDQRENFKFYKNNSRHARKCPSWFAS